MRDVLFRSSRDNTSTLQPPPGITSSPIELRKSWEETGIFPKNRFDPEYLSREYEENTWNPLLKGNLTTLLSIVGVNTLNTRQGSSNHFISGPVGIMPVGIRYSKQYEPIEDLWEECKLTIAAAKRDIGLPVIRAWVEKDANDESKGRSCYIFEHAVTLHSLLSNIGPKVTTLVQTVSTKKLLLADIKPINMVCQSTREFDTNVYFIDFDPYYTGYVDWSDDTLFVVNATLLLCATQNRPDLKFLMSDLETQLRIKRNVPDVLSSTMLSSTMYTTKKPDKYVGNMTPSELAQLVAYVGYHYHHREGWIDINEPIFPQMMNYANRSSAAA